MVNASLLPFGSKQCHSVWVLVLLRVSGLSVLNWLMVMAEPFFFFLLLLLSLLNSVFLKRSLFLLPSPVIPNSSVKGLQYSHPSFPPQLFKRRLAFCCIYFFFLIVYSCTIALFSFIISAYFASSI